MTKPMPLSIIVDTREQCPFRFQGHSCYEGTTVTAGTLATGDYSIAGLTHLVAVERKSLADLVGCLGSGRERFERELERARALEAFAVVCEGSFPDLAHGEYRGRLNPHAACQSICAWMSRLGIPFFFAGSRGGAEYVTHSFLRQYAEGKRKELKAIEKALAGKGCGARSEAGNGTGDAA